MGYPLPSRLEIPALVDIPQFGQGYATWQKWDDKFSASPGGVFPRWMQTAELNEVVAVRKKGRWNTSPFCIFHQKSTINCIV